MMPRMKPTGVIRVQGNWKPIDRGDAAALGLKVHDLATSDLKHVGEVLDQSVWIEIPLPGRWLAAFRLANQLGQPIVAEMRLFPHEPDREAIRRFYSPAEFGVRKEAVRRPAGHWSGDCGMTKNIQLPAGGITARVLRTIRRKQFKEVIRTIMENVEKHEIVHLKRTADERHAAIKRLKKPGLRKKGKDLVAQEIERLDKVEGFFGLLAGLDVGLTKPAAVVSSGRGRKGRPDIELARAAAIYVRAYLADKPTNLAVAKGLKLSPSKARDVVHRARIRGMLTDADKQGSPGGVLTPQARALLKQHRNKTMKGERHGT